MTDREAHLIDDARRAANDGRRGCVPDARAGLPLTDAERLLWCQAFSAKRGELRQPRHSTPATSEVAAVLSQPADPAPGPAAVSPGGVRR